MRAGVRAKPSDLLRELGGIIPCPSWARVGWAMSAHIRPRARSGARGGAVRKAWASETGRIAGGCGGGGDGWARTTCGGGGGRGGSGPSDTAV